MSQNILLINGHEPYAFAKGSLNQAAVDHMRRFFERRGDTTHVTHVCDDYQLEEEVERHKQADCVIAQFPVYWMGVPAAFKKYIDIVYTAGHGHIYAGDGRTRSDASKQYGTGGLCRGKKYMLSVTFNAPIDAFNDPKQTFFQGKSVDDLLCPVHLTYQFFAMDALPTFAFHDVMKNPQIEKDFERLDQHLQKAFA